MQLTEDQLFAKGAAALKMHIDGIQEMTRREIGNLREHYESGHNGRHPIPTRNSPVDMLYKIMGEQMLEMQFLRQFDEGKFGRLELVYWILSGLVFATVRTDTKWKDFERDMLAGVDAFCDRQRADIERPETRRQIVSTGEMIARMEAATGKSFEEVVK